MMTMKQKATAIAATAAVIAAATFYFIFDPMQSAWMPQCVFLRTTGFACPGCGAQRAIHSLLHLDFAGAFHANAMLVASLPLVAFLLWLETQRGNRPMLYRRVYSTTFILLCGGSLAAWGIIRNIIGI